MLISLQEITEGTHRYIMLIIPAIGNQAYLFNNFSQVNVTTSLQKPSSRITS